MKEKHKKRTLVKWCFLFALSLLALAFPATLLAASNTRQVTVNGSLKGSLEKKKDGWYLSCEELEIPKKLANQRVALLQVKGRSPFSKGFYYYERSGRLAAEKRFHALQTKAGGRTFSGNYYFGGKNGRLYEKKGWVTVKGKSYFISPKGKRYENRWREGYYLNKKGQIAKNTKTPDGKYVDCDGKRCKKEEMALSGLKKSLNNTIAQMGGTWSVYVKDMKTGDVLYTWNKAFSAASVIKIFVMEGVYDSIKKGRIAKTPGVDSLLRSMIVYSDNECCNQLVRMMGNGSFPAGSENLNSYLESQGYIHSRCHSTLQPSSTPDYGAGQGNNATPKEAGILLEKIYKGTCVSKAYSKEMERLLLSQTRRNKIPAGLPAGVRCGNKTGEFESFQHDVAIVYGPKTDYVVCIFSNLSEAGGINGIRRLSGEIYRALNK